MDEIVFDTHGNIKQKQCAMAWCDDTIEEILYGGSKGGAKSFTGVSLIFGDALIYPGTHYFIARKELNDLRKYTIPSIHEVFEIWGITKDYYSYNGSDNFFELYNGSRVYLIHAKYIPSDPNYHRFGSMQMTRGWIEEAGQFEYDSYSNLKISIGRWKNDIYNLKPKLLLTANPQKNFLYKYFYLAKKNGTIEPWREFIQALPYDNKKLTPEYIQNLERTLKKNEKERLLKGNWEYDDDDNALCEYEAILSMFKNDHIPVENEKKYITADIARFGSDEAIIDTWQGWKVIENKVFPISATTDIQAYINHQREKHGIPTHQCIADEDGVGGGVVDNCKIKGFVNNSSPIDENIGNSFENKDQPDKPNYANLQTQCAYKLAEKINKGEIWYAANISESDKEKMTEDLEQLKSDNTDGGKLRILSKTEIKALTGRSPDRRDTLLMRVWFDIQPSKPKLSYKIR